MNLTCSYSLVQALYWMNYGTILGFTSVYLLDAGLTNTEIGILIATTGAVCTFLQPLLAGYADKPKSLSIKKLSILAGIAMAALSAVMAMFAEHSLLIAVLTYGGLWILIQSLTPFIYSMGIESINQGKKLDYGVAKAMGSVAYAINMSVMGMILAKAGNHVLPMFLFVMTAAFTLYLLFFPFEKTRTTDREGSAQTSGGLIYFYKKYRWYCLTLVGCIFTFTSHVYLNNFAFQITSLKGGGSSEMGTVMSLAALAELPTLLLFTFLLKKLRAGTWFWISGVFFAIKAVGSWLAPDVPAYYLVQLTQMGGWAINTVAALYYVNSIMEPQDVIKGQAYVTTAYTAASVIGSLTGGAIIDLAGVNAMLIVSVISAVIGMVIIFVTVRNTKTRETIA